MPRESIGRLKPGEDRQLARKLAKSGLDEFYASKKQEFDQLLADFTGLFLRLGKIVAELQKRSRVLVMRLAQDTRMPRELLENLAGAYEVFGELPTRPGLASGYYLQAAETVAMVGGTWNNVEVSDAVRDEALKLLETINPRETGQREMAAILGMRFGVINPGSKPFVGLPPINTEKLGALKDQFHPTIRDEFDRWAEMMQNRPQEALPVEAEEVAVVTLRLTNPPAELDAVISNTLLKAGLEVTAIRSQVLSARRRFVPRLVKPE